VSEYEKRSEGYDWLEHDGPEEGVTYTYTTASVVVDILRTLEEIRDQRVEGEVLTVETSSD